MVRAQCDDRPKISYSDAMRLRALGRSVKGMPPGVFGQEIERLITQAPEGARKKIWSRLDGYEYQYLPDKWGALNTLLEYGIDIHGVFQHPKSISSISKS